MDDDFDPIGGVQEVPAESSYRATAGELRQFIERVESIERELKAFQTDRSEVYAEAKARGYDIKVMKKIIKIRKIAADELAEQEAVEQLYREALGL